MSKNRYRGLCPCTYAPTQHTQHYTPLHSAHPALHSTHHCTQHTQHYTPLHSAHPALHSTHHCTQHTQHYTAHSTTQHTPLHSAHPALHIHTYIRTTHTFTLRIYMYIYRSWSSFAVSHAYRHMYKRTYVPLVIRKCERRTLRSSTDILIHVCIQLNTPSSPHTTC